MTPSSYRSAVVALVVVIGAGCTANGVATAPSPRVVVGGSAVATPGALTGEPLLSNDLMRLRLVTTPDQRAGISAEVRGPDGWRRATSDYYGDWTFVDSSVMTSPTKIELLSATSDEVSVRWTFGNHHTGRATDRSHAYPFTKTVWLRRGAYGYYTWISPLHRLEQQAWYAEGMSEHEVGFGGLWGPATIRTAQGRIRTEQLRASAEFTEVNRRDAAEFALDGDPLVRILVPIPAARLFVPRFNPATYGGVFVHHLEPRSYGAYLYAAPRRVSEELARVRETAWREAPAQMRSGLGTPVERGH